jgi:4'-phosphopantetheinyl transferase
MNADASVVYWAERAMPADAEEIAAEIFSKEEMVKLAGLRFPRRRNDWMIGRITAKQLYRRSPGFPGKVEEDRNISVRNEADGAPYFFHEETGRLPGMLSISHRDEQAFCAWSADADLKFGVDLEKIEPRGDIPLDVYFSVQEQMTARSLALDQQDAWITLVWSIKEAVLKGRGIGLRVDTRRIEVIEIQGSISDADARWRPFRVVDRGDEWNGFWRRRGDLFLTIAGAHGLKRAWGLEEIQV